MTASADLDDVIDELDRFPRRAVELVNDALAAELIRQVRTDTGGDQILSGAARRGQSRTKLTVRKKIDGTVYVVGTVSAGPAKARAQWAWLDTGTRRRGRHPGTPAKRTFSGPAEQLLPVLARRVGDRFQIAITR